MVNNSIAPTVAGKVDKTIITTTDAIDNIKTTKGGTEDQGQKRPSPEGEQGDPNQEKKKIKHEDNDKETDTMDDKASNKDGDKDNNGKDGDEGSEVGSTNGDGKKPKKPKVEKKNRRDVGDGVVERGKEPQNQMERHRFQNHSCAGADEKRFNLGVVQPGKARELVRCSPDPEERVHTMDG